MSAHDFSRIPIHGNPRNKIQTKLKLNAPGDVYEQEAERIAEQVIRTPEPHCVCEGGCPKCKNEQDGQQQSQARNIKEHAYKEVTVPPVIQEVISSHGQPLDSGSKEYFESRFGHDFSHVRIHTNARAAQSARDLGAQAYTVGRDIILGEVQRSQATDAGRRLLAHEFTHVVQQGFAPPLRGRRNGISTSAVPASASVILRSIVVDSSKFTSKNAAKDLNNFQKLIIKELEPITGLSLSFVKNELVINSKRKTKSKGSAKAAQILRLGLDKKLKRKIQIIPSAGSGASHTPGGIIKYGTKSPSVVLKGLSPGLTLLHELAHEFAGKLKANNYDKRVAAIEKRVKSGKASFRESAFWKMADLKHIHADENIPTEAINIVRSELGLGIQRTGYWIPLQFPYRPKEKDPKKRVTSYTQFKIKGSPPFFLYIHSATFEVFCSTVDFYQRPFEADGFPPIPKSSEMRKVTPGSNAFKNLRKYFR
jgi:hypothetical protein